MDIIHLLKDHDGLATYTPATEQGDFANGIWVRIPVDRWGTKGSFFHQFNNAGTSFVCHLEGSVDEGNIWHIMESIDMTDTFMTTNPLATLDGVQKEVTLWPLMRAHYIKGAGTYTDNNTFLII